MRPFLVTVIAVTFPLLQAAAQGTGPESQSAERRGTCAITAHAPFGISFIIDSRITETDASGHVKQYPGCKVRLARPTILLAGIGLEDTTGRAGHWNSLDQATNALKTLPDNPTFAELKQWSLSWGETLIRHYRAAGEVPGRVGELADVLLITKVKGEPVYQRIYVSWDGTKFVHTFDGQNIDKSIPQIHYAGACRDFAKVDDGEGHLVGPRIQRTPSEQSRYDHWGTRKADAKSVTQLGDAVYGLMSLSADIDARLEGDHPVIARPFAAAEWPEGQMGWSTEFNSECKVANP